MPKDEDRQFYDGFFFALRVLDSIQKQPPGWCNVFLEQVRAVARGEVSLVYNPAEVAKSIEDDGNPVNDAMRKAIQQSLGGANRAAMDAEDREKAQRIVAVQDDPGE